MAVDIFDFQLHLCWFILYTWLRFQCCYWKAAFSSIFTWWWVLKTEYIFRYPYLMRCLAVFPFNLWFIYRNIKYYLFIILCFNSLGPVNTLRPRKYGCHFGDNSFKCMFLNENAWLSIEISLKFVSNVPTNNIPALVQIMASRWPGNRLLSEPVMVRLPTNIYASLGLDE